VDKASQPQRDWYIRQGVTRAVSLLVAVHLQASISLVWWSGNRGMQDSVSTDLVPRAEYADKMVYMGGELRYHSRGLDVERFPSPGSCWQPLR
jgi:hypothetical protein